MMYEIIAQELNSMQMENSHPQDYLNFYCLGNREEVPQGEPGLNNQTSNGELVTIQILFSYNSIKIMDDDQTLKKYFIMTYHSLQY